MKHAIFLLSLVLSVQFIQAQDKSEDIPVAPYSAAIMTPSGLLFISGHIPIDPESGKVMKGDIAGETRMVMDRIGKVLEENGMDYSNLVKCTVFLTDIRDYKAMNKVYRPNFVEKSPKRVCVVVGLEGDAMVEMDAIAVK